MRIAPFAALMLATTGLVAGPVAQGDSPVVSAAIRVVRKSVPVARIAITNTRDTPLETWRAQLSASDGSRTWTSEADFNGATVTVWPGDDGPIRPHETRTVLVRLGTAPRAISATLSMAVFADGSFEGNAGEVRMLLADRADKARDLAYWLDVIDATPRTTSKDADAFLQDRAAEYKQISPRDPNYLRERLTSLLDGRRPADSVFAQLDNMETEVARRLDARQRMLTRVGNVDPASLETTPVVSASVHAEIGTATDIVALIENRSPSPIEAWRIEESAPPASVRSGGQDPWSAALPSNGVRIDTCGTSHQIKPHETREVFLHAAETLPDDFTPHAALTLIVFSTLTFEGRKVDFDQVLRQREFEAETYRFWIDAATMASTTSAAEAARLLRAKLDESESATSGSLDREASDTIERVTHLPAADAAASLLREWRDALVTRRAALLRHTRSGVSLLE